jgi:hypothetical protein
MSSPATTIKRWQIGVVIYALFIAALTIFEFMGAGGDSALTIVSVLFGITTALLAVALFFLFKENYKAGGLLTIIAGVLTIPIGALMIMGGIKIRSAATQLENDEYYRGLGHAEESKS